MKRRILLFTLIAGVLVIGPFTAVAAGPPASLASSLTPNGRVLWNLDAVVNDTFGGQTDCFDGMKTNIFAVGKNGSCPSPQARYQEYVFTFLNAFHSQFRLVSLSKPPIVGATSVAVRVDGKYVACPQGEYGHSGPGWVMFGGGNGPTGLFWCD